MSARRFVISKEKSLQVMKMHRHEDYDQLKLEMPFGVTLREDNRWVVLSKKFPWGEIDQEYQKHFKSSGGQVAELFAVVLSGVENFTFLLRKPLYNRFNLSRFSVAKIAGFVLERV